MNSVYSREADPQFSQADPPRKRKKRVEKPSLRVYRIKINKWPINPLVWKQLNELLFYTLKAILSKGRSDSVIMLCYMAFFTSIFQVLSSNSNSK